MSDITPPIAIALPTAVTFPPMYYDSPVNQLVLTFEATASGSLTAAVTAGAPYFRVTTIEVGSFVVMPVVTPPPPRTGVLPDVSVTAPRMTPASTLASTEAFSAVSIARIPRLPRGTPTWVTTATSDGTTPVAIKQGQTVKLWVTAEVPKGSALAPGKFTGTATVTGASTTKTVAIAGTYLGTLMGTVTVTPSTVVPGQSALVQVCDAAGKPLSDPSVTVIIQGTPAAARYYQFPTVGTRSLFIVASRGALTETTTINIPVTGTALAFHPSLKTPPTPAVTEIPMLQVSIIIGQPYTATFTLGNTPGIRRILAATVAQAAAKAPTATATSQVKTITDSAISAAGPSDALGVEVTGVLAKLPAEQVTTIAPVTTKTATGTVTVSSALAPIGGLTTKPETTSYQWDFGDGTTLTTQAPTATHNYFPAIRAGDVTRPFDVSCTVVHDNVTIKRTLVLHSAYGLSKQLGTIVPPVTGDVYATFQNLAFSATLIVTNLEASAITLSAMAVVPITDDSSFVLPAPSFTTMRSPVVIAANSVSAVGFYVPASQLKLSGAVTNGFTVYYRGALESGAPVRFSYTLRIRLSDSGMTRLVFSTPMLPANWDVSSALSAVSAIATQSTHTVSKAGGQTVDPATNTVAIALSADPSDINTLTQVRAAVQAGLTDIAQKTGALSANGASLRLSTLSKVPLTPATAVGAAVPKAPTVAAITAGDVAGSAKKLITTPAPIRALNFTYDPLNPPPVAVGAQCYPDDISDADAATAAAQQLVCQLTSNTQTVTLPSSFQNAQQGDIILSPAPVGSGDLIAAMFARLVPPQHHGHSGMMTANYVEITHCTAAPSYVEADMNTESVAGVTIPTSLNGDRLQYAWPGALVQSIDDATDTMYIADSHASSGTPPYSFNSFTTDSLGDGFELIPPFVVKPLPENEAMARPILRKAADLARSKGATYPANGDQYNPNKGATLTGGSCYYSFYCYTDPQESAGFTDVAPAGAGIGGWAAGKSPAVCASFIWLSLKATTTAAGTPIPLVSTSATETLGDFPPAARRGGVQVGPATLDGLFYYPQSERQLAAQGLYNMFMEQALSQEGGFGSIPGVNSGIAGPIADQLLNCFASGNPNLVGSPAWRTPGDGNAVSPDNIMWWNPPYYGYAESLQYLPRHTEQYTESQWTKVVTWGNIAGKVTYNGAPVPNAQVWVYDPGGITTTAADGTFTLSHIPIGRYGLKASATITIDGVSAEYTNYNQQNASGQAITLTAANPNVVQNINLLTNPIVYRRLDITYSISCDHSDGNPFNTHGTQTAGSYSQATDVNPGQPTSSLSYTYDYNGGGYFHITYAISVGLLLDLSLQVIIVATVYNDGDNNVQYQYTTGPIVMPVDGSYSGWIDIQAGGTGYTNGPAHFTFSMANNQQTG